MINLNKCKWGFGVLGFWGSHKSQLNFASNIFKSTSLALRIFVDNARSILTDLSNNGARFNEVSERYGVLEKLLRDFKRYYLFRSGLQVEVRTKKLKLSLRTSRHSPKISKPIYAREEDSARTCRWWWTSSNVISRTHHETTSSVPHRIS